MTRRGHAQRGGQTPSACTDVLAQGGQTPSACAHVLHNMSVPPSSRVTVSRIGLPGRRFAVDLAGALDKKGEEIRDQLARRSWRGAWSLVGHVTDTLDRAFFLGQDPAEEMERHFLEALRQEGVPDRPGVFLEPVLEVPDRTPRLSPIAALAVLSRRSGPLYIPTRRPEPSLADPRQPLVLYFPEEESL